MLYSFHSVRMRKIAIMIGRYVLHKATICFERNMLINQRICNKNEIQALNDGSAIHFTSLVRQDFLYILISRTLQSYSWNKNPHSIWKHLIYSLYVNSSIREEAIDIASYKVTWNFLILIVLKGITYCKKGYKHLCLW